MRLRQTGARRAGASWTTGGRDGRYDLPRHGNLFGWERKVPFPARRTYAASGALYRPVYSSKSSSGMVIVGVPIGAVSDATKPVRAESRPRHSALDALGSGFPGERKHHDARAPRRRPGAGRSCTTSRRKRNSAAGRPPVAVEVSPVGSTNAAVSTSRRKFCLCRRAARDRLDRALQFGEREFGAPSARR